MGVSCTDLDAARRHLARIRCLNACVRCLETQVALPEPLAYVPAVLRYGAERNTKVGGALCLWSVRPYLSVRPSVRRVSELVRKSFFLPSFVEHIY